MRVGHRTKQTTYLLNAYAENPLAKNIYVENNFCLVTINTQSETSCIGVSHTKPIIRF